MRVTAAWDTIIPPLDERTQFFYDFEETDHVIPLPKDGLPRITSEGVDILLEGLRGDFHRWRWSIGNHPLELPAGCTRNLMVRAMKDEPHYIAEYWTGLKWPRTKSNVKAMGHFCFDMVDTMVNEYATAPRAYIELRQTADYWASAPIFVDDIEIWEEGQTVDDEDDGMVDCACTPVKAPAPATTLDRWVSQ